MEFLTVTHWILPSLIFGGWDSRKQGFQSFSRMMSKDDASASWMQLLLHFLKIGCSLPIESSNNLQWEFLCGYRVEGGVCGLWVFY